MEKKERRQFRRVYFSIQDGIQAIFSPTGQQELEFSCIILNIGPGGLHFTLEKNNQYHFTPGDPLFLKKITGEPELKFVHNIETRIAWVIDHHSLEQIGYGCEFVAPSDHFRSRMVEFIHSTFNQKDAD